MRTLQPLVRVALGMWALAMGARAGAAAVPAPQKEAHSAELVQLLDAPLLFVKRHSYTGIHIYDTYYKWPPGGGGIYVLENPAAPRAQWKIRPVVDPTTPNTPGAGVYSHPELSWDAKRLLFCFKGEPTGNTSIYEVGIDGRGLRRLTDPGPSCDDYKGSHSGQHDIAPAYLPDGRIVLLSTRPSGLVPCNNTGVAILHVMNADGSDIHPISVNNVNEFDPVVLPDGRILFGRWEYVDKNALTIQSLWSVNPDGTQETAVFANNMVFPEAVLDARPIPGTQRIVGTLAKHNAPPRGSIGIIDPQLGKNSPAAIRNLEHPEDPTFDRGDSCEPWPVTREVVLFSGRPAGSPRNVIELVDTRGRRMVLLSDPDICLHSPMLVKPRPRPPIRPDTIDRSARTGRFFVQDIYRGLPGVPRGSVRWLRVIEETSRVSKSPGGGNPYNQTFLVSAALAFSVKNFLGIVPVEEDGSVYFEVPAGRSVYFQALDGAGRLVQSMRTFVQAAPGTTRSCIGCHEYKFGAADNAPGVVASLAREPRRLQKESWGSGYVDFPTMVQPVLDRHCVSCHGGAQGIAAGMDLSAGWTEHFSIAYENLVNRCETQLVAYWISGIDCMNGTAHWSAQLFAPRSHGSGSAPLARLLVEGHGERLPNLSRPERDLLLAWIDSNGLYHGTWDYTESGCAIRNWGATREALIGQMRAAGCLNCHGNGTQISAFESDWINLKDLEWSRILRAPLAPGAEGMGLGLCRNRQRGPEERRLKLLWNGYAHAVLPIDKFARQPFRPTTGGAEPPVISFTSTADKHYQAMLAIIRRARQEALSDPRVDLPGANVIDGECRQFLPPALPPTVPSLTAEVDADGLVHLSWEQSAETIGLEFELHRGERAGFVPSKTTILVRTARFRHVERRPPTGEVHYALVYRAGKERSQPGYTAVTVPAPVPPPAPVGLNARPASYAVRLEWQPPRDGLRGYHVYRHSPGAKEWTRLTGAPIRQAAYVDTGIEPNVAHQYQVRAVDPRGVEGPPTAAVTAAATIVEDPVFVASFQKEAGALLRDGQPLAGNLHGGARCADGALQLKPGGFATFPHDAAFDLGQPISVACRVRFDEAGAMPVIVSCGVWRQAGWFLQRLGNRWRWHVGGIDCDGGNPTVGKWFHLVAVFDGKTARLYENGVLVAEQAAAAADTGLWPGPLYIGQYSGQPSPPYQVAGAVGSLRIFHRPLTPAELRSP